MNAEEHLRAGQVDEALKSLREQVRKSPADGRLRIFLFQLLCVVGEWEKALTQLQVIGNLDAESMLMARIYSPVVHCEAFRKEVFAGRRSPLIFGEPEEWIGHLVQANHLLAEGNVSASNELRARAFEAAPTAPGKINDQPFEWIADSDTRLGPMLEAMIDGRYYWVPFARIQRVHMEPPGDLRNLVWTPAQFTWINGGSSPGFIPSRYVGSEHAESSLRLARKTEWEQKGEDVYLGLGQRQLSTDVHDYALLEVRSIDFTPASAAMTYTTHSAQNG